MKQHRDSGRERFQRQTERRRLDRMAVSSTKSDALEELSRGLNLRIESKYPDPVRLTGSVQGASVEIEGKAPGWKIVARRGDLPTSLTFHRETTGPLAKLLRREDVQTGDDAFDGLLNISGEPTICHGLFDARTRKLIEELLRCGELWMESGALCYSSETGSTDEAPQFRNILFKIAALAASLAVDDNGRLKRLERICRDEAEPSGVRVRCLEALATLSQSKISMTDPRDLDTWPVDHQIRFAKISGALLTEEVWLAGLQSGTTDVQLLALTRLADVGTSKATEAISSRASEFFASAAFKQAARTAVARIEARLRERRGRLSLAETDGGRLSVASDDAGGLSGVDAEG